MRHEQFAISEHDAIADKQCISRVQVQWRIQSGDCSRGVVECSGLHEPRKRNKCGQDGSKQMLRPPHCQLLPLVSSIQRDDVFLATAIRPIGGKRRRQFVAQEFHPGADFRVQVLPRRVKRVHIHFLRRVFRQDPHECRRCASRRSPSKSASRRRPCPRAPPPPSLRRRSPETSPARGTPFLAVRAIEDPFVGREDWRHHLQAGVSREVGRRLRRAVRSRYAGDAQAMLNALPSRCETSPESGKPVASVSDTS